ncbi:MULTISPECIES: GNAT family protein [Clostridia]|uniref:GNAT family N-acetyltransferase n=1 Tax=Clostridia TaxID=186801 RepID=UPI000EA3B3AB|nr:MULTISPECIES: GNAT family protein [Clostridia]NBJ71205.1 N-acetyltransferase [Roseburia sp. 1XD42-34]RKI75065.1 N-acetyltransferase [Clostridium sp. 1xD42-85]
MNITTKRLFIRHFELRDWEAVYSYASQKSVMKYMPEGVLTKEETQKMIKNNLGKSAEKFPVVLANENTLIGHMEFFNYFGGHTYEIGWVFHPTYYNQGYASEAALALLKYGFEELGLHRIVATCQPENIPSFRVMEKIGMRREGHFKKCIPYGDEWWDEYAYAVLNEEWNNRSF